MPTLTRKRGQRLLVVVEGKAKPVVTMEFSERVDVSFDHEPGVQVVREEAWKDPNPARRQPTGDEADRTD